jgi:hypothetical protein
MPTQDIPQSLLNEVREGRVVLVLGVGASIGAKSGDGKAFPTSPELDFPAFCGHLSKPDSTWLQRPPD